MFHVPADEATYPHPVRFWWFKRLTTLGIAFLLHTLMGQFRGDLLLYAAAVVFVSVHGSLTGAQWRALA